MRAPLHADSYRDERTFGAEQRSIFRASFQLAGLDEDLQSDASWIRTEVGGRSVVVQNFAGTLRAFLNVCAHRQSRLRSEPAGCGALRCPYHGWTYGADGQARGIPERTGFAATEIAHAKLTPYEVVRFGPLVFVREGGSHPGVAEQDFAAQLGPLHARLQSVLAGASGRSFDRFSVELRCNWKVLIENSIEGYHVASVHPDTIGPLANREVECVTVGGSSLSLFDSRRDERRAKLLAHALPERPLSFGGYLHALLFPNITVATAQGALFIVTRTVPLAIDRCRLDVFLLGARHREDATSLALAPAVAAMNSEFVRKTFDEDARVCEGVQAGLQDAEAASMLHAVHEHRVFAFQAKVLELMTSA